MRRTLSVIGGILVGLALSQFPEYAQQYTQRLGGAIDELKVITEDFDRGAAAGNLTREQALDRFEASNDSFLAGRGDAMEGTFDRYDSLVRSLDLIQGANPVERFGLLPQFLDTDIGAATLDNFKPAVPVTTEGFVYAGAGFVGGYLIVSALWTLCALPFRRRRTRWA